MHKLAYYSPPIESFILVKQPFRKLRTPYRKYADRKQKINILHTYVHISLYPTVCVCARTRAHMCACVEGGINPIHVHRKQICDDGEILPCR